MSPTFIMASSHGPPSTWQLTTDCRNSDGSVVTATGFGAWERLLAAAEFSLAPSARFNPTAL